MRMIEHDAPHEPVDSVVENCRTLGDMLVHRAASTPDRMSCYSKADGRWQGISWGEFLGRAQEVAGGLLELGLEVGDVIAIVGPTHLDWAIEDLAGHLAGLVTVGIYPRQTPDQVRYLLEHSDARVVFVGDEDEMETLLKAIEGLDKVRVVIPWNDKIYKPFEGRDPRLHTPRDFKKLCGEKQGREKQGLEKSLSSEELERRRATIDPADPAILVYTSGTTGRPKGAMISHNNILTVLRAHHAAIQFFQDDLMISFLPMAHVTERILLHYSRINVGMATAYASSIGVMLDELREVRPTIFGSVPRPLEKLYDRVMTGVASSSATRRAIFAWADRLGRRRARYILAEQPVPATVKLPYGLAMRLIFRRIHEALGGRVRACFVGAAPIAPDVLEFLWAADLPTFEAYGMTEATVLTHINRPGAVKLGSVGQVVSPTECRLADDGEILIRGPLVFKGYLKNPEATAEAVVDGWLHTGDVGEIDEQGFLRLTDRKKHLIITAGGKNVAPASIERAIKPQSPLISQVHAHGDRRPYICALIAPSPLETLDWGVKHELITAEEMAARQTELSNPAARSPELDQAMGKVVQDRRFQELFRDAVCLGNQKLARVEKVRRYVVLGRDFSLEQGEMTPTMKLKRKVVEEKFSDLFDRVYSEEDFAIEAEPQS